MNSYIALLRAVNVAGRNMLSMSDLRALAEDLGLEGARTLLQSGNLVFQSKRQVAAAALERRFEEETARRLNLSVDYFIRSADELETVIDRNPFSKESVSDPGHLLVLFLKAEPPAKSIGALKDAVRGPEYFRSVGTHLYIVYPAGIGRSKLTTAVIEKTLGTRGTGRNWNTVLKLAALTAEST